MRDSGKEADTERERTDHEWKAQIAGYVSTWLRERFHSRSELDQFLMRHPRYEFYRDALHRECRLSCIACVLIAIRAARRETGLDTEFMDYLQEQVVRPAKKRRAVGNRQLLALTDEEKAKIADYVKIHQYICLKAKNADSANVSTVHSCITSIGYMTVKSVVEQGSAGSDEFGATVHLLHELVTPLLRSAVESTWSAVEKEIGIPPALIHREEQAQAG